MGVHHPRPPGGRPDQRDARRGAHDRPARPGLRQRRRHGDGGAVPARALRPRGHRPPHLRDRLRRRPDGGHRVRGGVAGRAARARPADLPLRRQRHLARRAHVVELRPGERRPALRVLRLARAGRAGRQRRGWPGGGDPRRPRGRRPPVADPGQVGDRLPVAQQVRYQQGPRFGPRRRGGRLDQGGHGLGPGQDLLRARRCLRVLQHGRGGCPDPRGVERALRALAGRGRGACRGLGPGLGGSTPAGDG